MPTPSCDAFKGYRFPQEIISHAVWLYYRFSLSLRDVEDILAYRGVDVSHQPLSKWEQRLGPLFGDVICRNRPRPGDKAPIGYEYKRVSGRGNMLVRVELVASILAEALAGYASGRFETQVEVKRFPEGFPDFPLRGFVRCHDCGHP